MVVKIKKQKAQKKYVIKKMLKFENYGKYLEKKISYSYKKIFKV